MTRETKPLGGLLFLDDADVLPSALPQVNALLARQRARGSADGAVLAVVIGRSPVNAPGRRDVELRHAAGQPGHWSLCWFSAGSPDAPSDPGARLLWLLDAVLGPEAGLRVAPAIAPSQREALEAELRRRYPGLEVRPGELIDDPARGGLVRGA